MSYVVTENDIKCKHTDCVDVCPVDCFHEGETMLVIDPDQCIDCGICVPGCPVKATKPESDAVMQPWANMNRKYSNIFPAITFRKPAPDDASEWDNFGSRGACLGKQQARGHTEDR